jgi:hypothetical protein
VVAAPVEVHAVDTVAAVPATDNGHGAVWARRIFIVLLGFVVIAGGLGLLGGHTATATATRGGYQMSLQYPGIERAGIDTVWELTVVHPGGFSGPITISVTGDYFDLFETQGFYPTPSTTTRDAKNVYLTFTKPAGDTLVVMFDAYIQPYSVLGKGATVAVVEHGVPVDSISYHTWLLP